MSIKIEDKNNILYLKFFLLSCFEQAVFRRSLRLSRGEFDPRWVIPTYDLLFKKKNNLNLIVAICQNL